MEWPVRARDAAIGAGCRALSLPFRFGRGERPGSPCRIVLIKQGSIGDVLMSTASVRALRACLPEAHIAFAVGAWSRPIVAGNARLDEILDLGSLGGRRYRLGDYWAAVRSLRAGRYDLALVFDRAPLITLLPFLAGIRARVGLDSEGRGFSLTRRVQCPQGGHEVERYLDVVRELGCPTVSARLEFYPSADDRAVAEAAIGAPGSGTGNTGRPLVAIHPGGGVNPGMTLLAKRWPPARFAELADRLRRELGASVVLVGGADDRAVAQALQARMEQPAVDLTGRMSWGQLGALLERAELLVANDTGAAHLATAVGTPAVVVFGPTDAAQYGPYGALGEAVTAGVPCSPCFRRGRFPPCHFGQRCLVDLGVEPVWGAVQRCWARRQARAASGSMGEGGS